MRSIPSHR
jgi:hypothetical protein